MTRRPFLVAACLTTVLVAAQALTTTPLQAQRANAAEAMALRHNADAQGLALKGYDPVAYFTLGQPTPGLRTITAVHAGVTYQFATDAHRTAFEAAPERYLPAYGGYCAMGMVGGRFFDIDPAAWRIEAGTLYLNKDPATQRMWLRDVPGNIRKADQRWPEVAAKR